MKACGFFYVIHSLQFPDTASKFYLPHFITIKSYTVLFLQKLQLFQGSDFE